MGIRSCKSSPGVSSDNSSGTPALIPEVESAQWAPMWEVPEFGSQESFHTAQLSANSVGSFSRSADKTLPLDFYKYEWMCTLVSGGHLYINTKQ